MGLNNIAYHAQEISTEFIDELNDRHKQQFYQAVERSIGVSISGIIQREDLGMVLTAKNRENISLIKSIPQEYHRKLENIIYQGITQGNGASSIIEEIQKLGDVTENRAKLIARDQNAKLNAALDKVRQESIGVEKYVWRTAGDNRVRDSHKKKNGKVFRWDKPPKDTGHPGNDINCRCFPQAIINI